MPNIFAWLPARPRKTGYTHQYIRLGSAPKDWQQINFGEPVSFDHTLPGFAISARPKGTYLPDCP